MRRTGPALLPVFRSRLQADILAALLLHPDREISLTDLARQVGAPLTTVHGEAQRLTDAGILARRQAGRSAMLRADPASRLDQAADRPAGTVLGTTARHCRGVRQP